MDLEFYRDGTGDPRARSGRQDRDLARFLESDVQGSAVVGRAMLAAIDRVADGHAESWETTGNAYTLAVSRDEAALVAEHEDDAEIRRMPLDELREALASWVAFLERSL